MRRLSAPVRPSQRVNRSRRLPVARGLRSVALLAALLLVVLASACGGSGAPAPSSAGPAATPAAQAQPAANLPAAPQPGQDPAAPLPPAPMAAPVPATVEEVFTGLADASSAEEAHTALLSLYGQIGVGVYSNEGVQLLAGAERGPDDFYLYEWESQLLGQAFTSKERFPIDRLARFLGESGYGNLDRRAPLTPEEMLAVLGDAVQRSRSDPSAFTFRLIDALGQTHQPPLDLTAPGLSPATTYLDATQLFLVLYDVFSEEDSLAQQGSPHLAALLPLADSSPCQFKGIPDLARMGGFLAAGQIARFGKYISIAGQSLDSIHDALVMLGYTVKVTPERGNTHWKHEPNEPNRDITFTAHVDFDLGKLNTMAKCGKMVGYSFPPQGASKDVSVEWEIDQLLQNQGAWQEKGNTYTTDAAGNASITFSPKVEARPGQGLNKSEYGVIMVRIMPRSFLNFRKVFDLIGVGPEFHIVAAGLEVARHVNLTMTIGGKYTSSDGFISMVFPETVIPLTVGDTQMTGSGSMAVEFVFHELPPDCKADAGIPMSLEVTGTGMDPVKFTVNGISSMNARIRCESGGQWVQVDYPAQMPSQGEPLQFSLSPKSGEKYSLTAPGMTGTLDFVLSEK